MYVYIYSSVEFHKVWIISFRVIMKKNGSQRRYAIIEKVSGNKLEGILPCGLPWWLSGKKSTC